MIRNTLLGIHLKEMKTCFPKDLSQKHFFYIPKLETIQKSISSKLDKYVVLYSYHRIHHNENHCSTTPNNIESSHKHNVECVCEGRGVRGQI